MDIARLCDCLWYGFEVRWFIYHIKLKLTFDLQLYGWTRGNMPTPVEDSRIGIRDKTRSKPVTGWIFSVPIRRWYVL